MTFDDNGDWAGIKVVWLGIGCEFVLMAAGLDIILAPSVGGGRSITGSTFFRLDFARGTVIFGAEQNIF